MPHNRSYSEQIDLMIKEHERAIEELTIAKKVIGKLVQHDTAPVKVKEPVQRGPHVQKMLIRHITSVLSTFKDKPARSSEIIDGLNQLYMWEGKKQRVWAALSLMKKDGRVYHNPEEGTYVLNRRKGETNTSFSETAQLHNG